MIYQTKEITIKNGQKVIFRAPTTDDAEELAAYIKKCSGETDFLLRTEAECTETPEKEAAFLQASLDSPTDMMIVCSANGKIAGNCNLSFNRRVKVKHRASIGIGLMKEFWGRGIGTAMFEEMERVAAEKGVTLLTLEFIEGNDRAKALYLKRGFTVTGALENGIRLPSGKYLTEFSMSKRLD